ncbi:MAG TPA: RHS repeat domain-containing protein [Allosphingosinicella sp.]
MSVPSLAAAAETITYTYDAKGRLVQVVRSGTVNNGVTTTYAHDKADNRTGKTTTGSPNPPPP